jgi:hypothetical protein|tara:strand:- start:513 stop:1007 length:495 start_codon:yes stop_codon:yes gene_type:complete
MAFVSINKKIRFFQLIPLIILFYISLNGISVIDFKFFSINAHYILVYFWVLRQPKTLGYGFIFLSGIINDVVFGLPLGISSLSLLAVAGVAAYVRVVTVRISLLTDWISFIPALLVANFIYFIALYFSDYPISYIFLFKNSISTFIFYPILWVIFTLLLNLIKN